MSSVFMCGCSSKDYGLKGGTWHFCSKEHKDRWIAKQTPLTWAEIATILLGEDFVRDHNLAECLDEAKRRANLPRGDLTIKSYC